MTDVITPKRSSFSFTSVLDKKSNKYIITDKPRHSLDNAFIDRTVLKNILVDINCSDTIVQQVMHAFKIAGLRKHLDGEIQLLDVEVGIVPSTVKKEDELSKLNSILGQQSKRSSFSGYNVNNHNQKPPQPFFKLFCCTSVVTEK